MTAIKSYTDIEQSCELAEILPRESADMYWIHWKAETIQGAFKPSSMDIPCWSLAALLEYLREHHLFPYITNTSDCILMDVTFYDEDETKKKSIVPLRFVRAEGKSILDACYELILKLHKINML